METRMNAEPHVELFEVDPIVRRDGARITIEMSTTYAAVLCRALLAVLWMPGVKELLGKLMPLPWHSPERAARSVLTRKELSLLGVSPF
jgi:hypothetical protein